MVSVQYIRYNHRIVVCVWKNEDVRLDSFQTLSFKTAASNTDHSLPCIKTNHHQHTVVRLWHPQTLCRGESVQLWRDRPVAWTARIQTQIRSVPTPCPCPRYSPQESFVHSGMRACLSPSDAAASNAPAEKPRGSSKRNRHPDEQLELGSPKSSRSSSRLSGRAHILLT
jgi:hypothetical protein